MNCTVKFSKIILKQGFTHNGNQNYNYRAVLTNTVDYIDYSEYPKQCFWSKLRTMKPRYEILWVVEL